MNYLNIGIIETQLSVLEPSWLIDDMFVKPILYICDPPILKCDLYP